MAEKGRSALKNYFLKGRIPKEEEFHDLIDSKLNMKDDGLAKSKGESIKIQEEGSNKELIRFFKNISDLTPTWYINQITESNTIGFNIGEPEGGSRFFIQSGGNVGIGNTSPSNKLQVEGMVGMHGRKGYYKEGEVPADGHWHKVLSNLDKYQAFEVIAFTETNGKKGSHALVHAIALSTYGRSKNAIQTTSAHYGRSNSRIELRFTGDYFDFNLEIRTRKNYGEGIKIHFNIAKLHEQIKRG